MSASELVTLALPFGTRARARWSPASSSTAYRSSAAPDTPEITLERFWAPRFAGLGAAALAVGTALVALGIQWERAADVFALYHADLGVMFGAALAVPYVAGGLALLYVGLAELINRTSITIRPGSVVRRHLPLRWSRRREHAWRAGATARAEVGLRHGVRRVARPWGPGAHQVRLAAPDGSNGVTLLDLLGAEESMYVASALQHVLDAMSPMHETAGEPTTPDAS